MTSLFEKFFNTKKSVILIILLLLGFFDFAYLPVSFNLLNDKKLFYVEAFLLLLGVGKRKISNTAVCRRLNYLFVLLIVFAVVNCISCYYYRNQAPWVTFFHWSPIFLLFLYYPLRNLHFSINMWEKVLFSLFLVEFFVEILQLSFPELYLFNMTSSKEKFEMEFRSRVYGNAILYIGCLFCLNKALVVEGKKLYYIMLFLFSFVLIFLGGYRMVLFAVIISSVIMFYRIKRFGMKQFFLVLSFCVFGYAFLNTSLGERRMTEMIGRNADETFENEDYIRMVTLSYYYNEYFKSPVEMVLGSGMVERSMLNDNFAKNYESQYSREVSENSVRYHFFPIDWGLLGLSWEGGIPAAIILLLIALILIFSKTENRYLYLSSWGITVIIFSLTNGRYYSHHNLMYTVILLVICDKLYTVNNTDCYFKNFKMTKPHLSTQHNKTLSKLVEENSSLTVAGQS